ncbi:unnamed protein product [Phytomonas sp. Hart1]|nr:unnamed protein product [Phytomonas sp. Hart1]|eukprot:CCW71129.1 unnamed protein product [Phytomonas sp. isolate Hart1]
MNRVATIESQVREFSAEIVVVGSCFMDYFAYVDRPLQMGETLHSRSFQRGFGGKGANQAVAAGRLSAKVAMVSMVGNDGDGAGYIKQLRDSGVDTRFVFQHPTKASGLAMIVVDTNTSNNEIVICPNATSQLLPDFLRERTAGFAEFLPKSVRYVICQNEIPLPTTLAVLKAAHDRGIYTILNAAPAPTPEQVGAIRPYLRYVSLFCPNEVEAFHMTGVQVSDPTSAAKAILALQALGVRDVVLTLGAAGFVLAEFGGKPIHCAGKKVKAVDTTGAGDCFVGSAAYFLSRGLTLLEACKRANECAAISVMRKGTQTSYPTPSELPAGVI